VKKRINQGTRKTVKMKKMMISYHKRKIMMTDLTLKEEEELKPSIY
jgi:hypothetical protein